MQKSFVPWLHSQPKLQTSLHLGGRSLMWQHQFHVCCSWWAAKKANITGNGEWRGGPESGLGYFGRWWFRLSLLSCSSGMEVQAGWNADIVVYTMHVVQITTCFCHHASQIARLCLYTFTHFNTHYHHHYHHNDNKNVTYNGFIFHQGH